MKRKSIKKAVTMILAATMAVTSLTGCGGNGSGAGKAGDMIGKVELLELEGFDEAYLPDVSSIAQQGGQIDVVLLFDGTEKGWEALADEYMRIQGGYVNVKLDTTYTSSTVYVDKLRSELQGDTTWDIVQGNGAMYAMYIIAAIPLLINTCLNLKEFKSGDFAAGMKL